MKIPVLIVLIGACVANVAFEEWAKTHGKVYSSYREKLYRQEVWQDNMDKILAHNFRQLRGEATYTMNMNSFGDMTHEEYRAYKTVAGKLEKNPKIHYKGSTFMTPNKFTAPYSVDWRNHGYVTPIKDQAQCGSCWAFSTTGSLEGQHFKKTGKLVSFSEQQLVDCSGKFGNDGCDGGLMDWAFNYIMSVKGLETEKSYPYTAEDGECQYDATKAVSWLHGIISLVLPRPRVVLNEEGAGE